MSMLIIYSGGQTGVDRAALDAAIKQNIEHGGWCPKGRIAEDGRISNKYHLLEMTTSNYAPRTRKNIQDSDATLIIYNKHLKGGTLLTHNYAYKINKPVFMIDVSIGFTVDDVVTWLKTNSVKILNIAGPRESQSPGIYSIANDVINRIILKYSKQLMS